MVVAGFHEFKFLLGIIDERAEVFLFLFAQRVAEQLVHLALDVSRSVAQDVLERLVLAVQVGHEMLRGFGQVKDGFEIDDLGSDA